MQKVRKHIMFIVVSMLIVFISTLVVWFHIPYSPIKKQFQNDMVHYSNQLQVPKKLITVNDIEKFPEPVQKFFKVSGYLGQTKMTSMRADITSAPLKNSDDQPPMMVDYTLCSFAEEPVRLAYIQTSIFGIPFEAYDSTQNGIGFMKGVIGKVFTLFNQTGAEMDKAQLLTYLSECFIIPTSLFGEHIDWEAIDSTHAKATIHYKDISGSGIFTFDDKGFVISFQTNERAKIDTDGSVEYPKWSLVYGGYTEKNGVYLPTKLQTIWHESRGDFIYFDASNVEITFR